MEKNSRQKQNEDQQKGRTKNESLRRLDIYCLGQLESLLGVPREDLKVAAREGTSLYKPGLLVKPPLPFAKKHVISRSRRLDKPAQKLSRIQKRIYQRLLAPL